MRRPFPIPLRLSTLLLLLAVVACSPSSLSGAPGRAGNRIVTPPPERQQQQPQPQATPGVQGTPTAPTGPVRLRGAGMSASDLHIAYRALLDNYVDPVDDGQLISAAAESLRKGLQDQPVLPMVSMPVALVPPPTGNPERDWQAFGDAYDAVVNKLPDWARQAHADWLVLRGMAESLHDGHTSFLTPDEARRRNESSFVGIGVLLSRPQDNQQPLIAEIFPNSPAASSGLKRGDRIVAVDGQDTTGKTVADIATLIRGQAGTQVRLRVQRVGSAQPQEFTLRRAQVQVAPAFGQVVPNTPIGYLRIRNFSDESVVEQVLGVLDRGQQRGLRAWIVDLRGNPGGALRAVVGVAAGFVDDNHPIIGYQVDRTRRQTPLEVPQTLHLVDGSMVVVLVDRDTASGAEIFAAALQEAKLAQLVGSKTAGNVGVASQLQLPDSSVLQVTEQRFVTPSGAAIDGVGVTPDVVVDMTDTDIENDRDPQLAKALELVVQQLTGQSGR